MSASDPKWTFLKGHERALMGLLSKQFRASISSGRVRMVHLPGWVPIPQAQSSKLYVNSMKGRTDFPTPQQGAVTVCTRHGQSGAFRLFLSCYV